MSSMTRSRKLAFAIVVIIVPFTGTIFLIRWPRDPSATNSSASPDPLQVLFPPGYGEKVQKIATLLEQAPTSRPSASDSVELLDQAQHDRDFRIRVRAMAVLPFIDDREKAIDALVACVHDRESESSGGGNVPLYATTYLADMSATRAIPDVEDWVTYLQRKQPYDEKMRTVILKKSSEDLARLKRNAPTRPPS
jgi:hypothetical protein